MNYISLILSILKYLPTLEQILVIIEATVRDIKASETPVKVSLIPHDINVPSLATQPPLNEHPVSEPKAPVIHQPELSATDADLLHQLATDGEIK